MNARDRVVPRPRHDRAVSLEAGQPLETFSAQRRCKVEGCGARLSRYNPSDTCSLHKGWVDLRVRSPYGG